MKGVFIFIFCCLLMACRFQGKGKKLSGIMKLPVFTIMSIDSSACMSSNNIPTGRPIILMYFNPDCDHCQQETRELLAHIGQLRETSIYLVTNGDTEALIKYCQNFRLDTVKNLIIGKDYQYSFFRAYLPPVVPFIAIYNSRKELVKIYNGEIEMYRVIAMIK
jgi:hypothetical protein